MTTTLPTPTKTVQITVNGRALHARPGQTVMQAAADAGITIPGLCAHPHLRPEGACRVCLVEIEKQRTLQPACTFPVVEGMVVHTESEKAVASRKFTLQMLFSERSHYCMFCSMSGTAQSTDCELQRLAYQYSLDTWAYPPDYSHVWPLDASRKHFVMDHSRCILCRRCVRACNQVAANHTLGVQQRGTRTMVCADDGLPFGSSSCVSCGTCLEVCPTGALTDRRSVFMGHQTDVTRTKASCLGCSVTCAAEAITRDNQLLRVESDWAGYNGGVLCEKGRFDVLQEKPERIVWPLVRQEGRQVEVGWDKALSVVAAKFQEVRRVAGLASPRCTSESLAAFTCFFNEVLQSGEVALLFGDVPPLDLGQTATLAEVAAADCLVVIGGDPLEEQKVVGSFIKRAYDNDANILVIDDKPTKLDRYGAVHLQLEDISYQSGSPFERMRNTYHLRVSGITRLKAAVEAATRPVVIYGTGLTTTVYAALRALPPKVHFLPLVKGTNAVGAAKLGLSARPVHGDALYALLGDDSPDAIPLPDVPFKVVQAAYQSAWTLAADVVLPAPIWAEQKGHVVNMEGRSVPVNPLVTPPKQVHADWETLLRLSVRMGYTLSYDEIADISRTV